MFRNIFMTGLVGCALSAGAFAGEFSLGGTNSSIDDKDKNRRHEEVNFASCVFVRPPLPGPILPPPVKGAAPLPGAIPPEICSATVKWTTRFETGRFDSEDEMDEDDRRRGHRQHRFRPEFFDVVCGPPPFIGPISSFSVKRANDLDLIALGPILPVFLQNGAHNRDELLLVTADDLSSQILIANFNDEDEILDDLDDDRLERRRHRFREYPALLRHIVPVGPGLIPTKGGPVPGGPIGFNIDPVEGLCRIDREHRARKSEYKGPILAPGGGASTSEAPASAGKKASE